MRMRVVAYWLVMSLFFIPTLAYAQDSEQIIVLTEPMPLVYLPNPGMGWQNLAGAEEPVLVDTVAYLRRNGISWKILNPAPEDYAWHILDDLIEDVVGQGKQASFRVYTMIGEQYGGHQVPEWVVEEGAEILETGEPYYSNCVYQDRWGEFVSALRNRYDGNPNIAFIDIAGYGNFNEWNWSTIQTEWDDIWGDAYARGIESRITMTSIDSQARRRLIDTFIGGQVDAHQCYDVDGRVRTVSYDYEGFQETQLLMPYAGIRQSIQYMFSQTENVGFRFDCLGREDDVIGGLEDELDGIWRRAPIVFELCSYVYEYDSDMTSASDLLERAHGSIVHDNVDVERDNRVIERLMSRAGYRFIMEEARFPVTFTSGTPFTLEMTWYNDGYAPVYPRMGQDFELRLALTDASGLLLSSLPLDADIPSWFPAENADSEAPRYTLNFDVEASSLVSGTYGLYIGIFDKRTEQPIYLAIKGQLDNGWYPLGMITAE